MLYPFLFKFSVTKWFVYMGDNMSIWHPKNPKKYQVGIINSKKIKNVYRKFLEIKKLIF